jgi:hypothetical protein
VLPKLVDGKDTRLAAFWFAPVFQPDHQRFKPREIRK